MPLLPLVIASQPDAASVFDRYCKFMATQTSVRGTIERSFVPKPPAAPLKFSFEMDKSGQYAFSSKEIDTYFDGNDYYYLDKPNTLYYKINDKEPGMDPFVKTPSLRSNYGLYGFGFVPPRPSTLKFGEYKGRRAIVATFENKALGVREVTAYYDPKRLRPLAVVEKDRLELLVYEFKDLSFNKPTQSSDFVWNRPSSYRQSHYESEALLPLNSPAPKLTVKDPTGRPLALGELYKKNKLTIVDFWFYHCPGCMASMPKLDEIYRRYKDAGLGFVAVNYSDNPSLVQSFLKEKNYTFPVAMSGSKPSDDLVKAFLVTAYPTTYVVGADGKVLFRLVGIDGPSNYKEFEAALASGGIPIQPETP